MFIIKELTFWILIRISGTEHMMVGLRRLTSPLSPFMIAEDMSVMVLGVEYPTGTPSSNIVISDNISSTWARGR